MSNEGLKKLELLAGSNLLKTLRTALGPKAKLHLVGGTVRDLLLGQAGYDIDLATKLPPPSVTKALEHAGIRVVETGIEHGTLTAVIEKTNIEITTFRKPGNRTTSVFSDTIEEDLSGRDFTINAIAYSLDQHKLLDPYRGIEDLRGNLVKAVGSAPERIKEDPLRILRGIRFGTAQGRHIDPSLSEAISELNNLLKTVSVERVKSELEKILLSPFPAKALREMFSLNILEYVLPELLPGIGFEQNEFHNEDVFDHTLSVIQAAKPTVTQRLAALFHDLGKPHTLSVGEDGRRHFYRHEQKSEKLCQEAMRRLKFSNEETRRVSAIVAYHMRPLDCGPAGVRRLIRDLGPYFDDWLLFKEADTCPGMDPEVSSQQLLKFNELLTEEKKRQKGSPYGKLAVTGTDIIGLGVPEGPGIGRILKKLEEEVINDPEKNDREILMEIARTSLGAKKIF